MILSGGKAGQSDVSTFLFLSWNREVNSVYDESLRCGCRPTRAKGRIEMEEILKNKTAVVYGAGSIGGAVAAAFAKAGATVFVAAHHQDTLNKLADQQIQTERLDVLDKEAVAAFVKAVVDSTGH